MSDARRFVVVGDGDPEVLLGAIAARAGLEAEEALGVRRTFLDTADGRLAGSGTTLELRVPVRGEGEAALVWVADDTGEVLATVARPDGTPPRFATDLPPGPVAAPLAPRPARAHAFGLVEAWRGPILHWVLTGPGGELWRVKVQDPSFVNWPALEQAIRDNIVPDFPLCNKSFNLSYSGHDL